MKASHIIGLVVVAIAIAIIVSTFDNASNYVSFSEAKALSEEGNDNSIHVVGTLPKDDSGNLIANSIVYNPTQNPNVTYLQLLDEEGVSEKVSLLKPKPTDIEKSEKIVVIGRYQNGTFIAKDILMKCPSKYNENQLEE